MRIAIVGPGALGCLVAALLSLRTDHRVLLFDRNPQRAGLLRENGLQLIEEEKQLSCQVEVVIPPEPVGAVDIFLICVKAYDFPTAIATITPYLSASNLLITLQNGIAHLDGIERLSRGLHAALGVTAQGANMVASGIVRHAGIGPTRIGMRHGNNEVPSLLARAAAAFTEAGITTQAVADIFPYVWAKLFINVGINALTAIFDCPNGSLLTIPEAKKRMELAIREAEAVARAKGIPILEDPVAAAMRVCQATTGNISSMLQDVRKGKGTEVEAINGAIVAMAAQLELTASENENLFYEVRRLERTCREHSANPYV